MRHRFDPPTQSTIYVDAELNSKTVEGLQWYRGQLPCENLGDHVVGIKQNFGT